MFAPSVGSGSTECLLVSLSNGEFRTPAFALLDPLCLTSLFRRSSRCCSRLPMAPHGNVRRFA